MKIVVGLGNPGDEYERTRHNIGFMVLDCLARQENLTFSRRKFSSLIAEGFIEGADTILLKPLTYVNESGGAVKAVLKWFEVEVSDLLILCDDFVLPLGELRFRARGSSGGHNGLKSVSAHLGTEVFSRLRMGIGSPGRRPPADYVLDNFKKAEIETLEKMISRAADAVRFWLKSDINECMNIFNG